MSQELIETMVSSANIVILDGSGRKAVEEPIVIPPRFLNRIQGLGVGSFFLYIWLNAFVIGLPACVSA